MSKYPLLIGFILSILFLSGLKLRWKQEKKFNKFVDPILILHLFTLLLFFCPIFNSYFIGPYILSLALSISFIFLDSNKKLQDKLTVALIVFPLFIYLFSKMEHWWWAGYVSYFMILSVIVFSICIFLYPEKIRKELPYLLFFTFDIFYIPLDYLFHLH